MVGVPIVLVLAEGIDGLPTRVDIRDAIVVRMCRDVAAIHIDVAIADNKTLS